MQFILAIKGMLPMNVEELEKAFHVERGDADFLRVLRDLLRKEFLFM
jgi:hypothetical protein